MRSPGLVSGDAVDGVDPALVDRVRATLATEGVEPTPARVAAALRGERRVLGQAETLDVVGALRSELTGLGPLEPLLTAPGVTDILVNAPSDVWIDRGAGLERAPAHFATEGAVRRLAVRLAAAAGRRLDESKPSRCRKLAAWKRAGLTPSQPPSTAGSPATRREPD